jgi:glycosyltransferase involved in cell wall biosynthesis
MNSVILSTSDVGGGAAIAGYRLHEGLRRLGVHSRMLVRDKLSDDPDVLAHQSASEEPDWLLAAKASVSGGGRTDRSSTYFSLPWPGHAVENHPWVQEADVINIHWSAYFISPETLRHLLGLGKPVVLTLHDERAYTGGCHYKGDCRGHLRSCGGCPQLNDDFQPLAEHAFDLVVSCLQDVPRPAVVCPSQWLGNEARNSKLLQGCQVVVIPYGLDLSVFSPQDRCAARRWFGIPEQAVAVLIGAQYLTDHRKGFDVIQNAVREVCRNPLLMDRVAKGELVFVAYGRDGEKLRKTRLPFLLVGEVASPAEMAQLFSAVDLYVCSSREDNLPNTVLEAMACGVPVLGSNVGGIPDMVIDGQTGRLFPVGDSQALADLLGDVLQQPAILQGWGKAAREKCEREYDLLIQARHYHGLHHALLSAWPAGSPAQPAASTMQVQQQLETACKRAAERLPWKPEAPATEEKANPTQDPTRTKASWLGRIQRYVRRRRLRSHSPRWKLSEAEKSIQHTAPDAFLPPVPVLSWLGLHADLFRDLAPLLRNAKLSCDLSFVPPHPAETWKLRTERISLKRHSSENEEAAWIKQRPFALVVVEEGIHPDAFRLECQQLAAVGNLPILALGVAESSCRQIIDELGVGCWVPFDADALRQAVEWICQPGQQLALRRAAAGIQRTIP